MDDEYPGDVTYMPSAAQLTARVMFDLEDRVGPPTYAEVAEGIGDDLEYVLQDIMALELAGMVVCEDEDDPDTRLHLTWAGCQFAFGPPVPDDLAEQQWLFVLTDVNDLVDERATLDLYAAASAVSTSAIGRGCAGAGCIAEAIVLRHLIEVADVVIAEMVSGGEAPRRDVERARRIVREQIRARFGGIDLDAWFAAPDWRSRPVPLSLTDDPHPLAGWVDALPGHVAVGHRVDIWDPGW